MKWGLGLVLLIVGAGAFYFVPQMVEGTGDACSALAQVDIRRSGGSHNSLAAVVGATIGQAVGGPMMRAKMAQDHPNLPPGIACATEYWGALLH